MSLITESPSRREVWLCDPLGLRLCTLDGLVKFGVAEAENSVGSFYVTLPGDFDESLLKLDGMVEFWRAPAGGRLGRVGIGLIRDFDYYQDEQGRDYISISGPDHMDLLNRRIAAYKAGTAQAQMTDEADDMIKAIAADNYGGDATGSRNWSSLSFDIAADVTAGPSITKGFSHRNTLLVTQEIAELSRQNGTKLYFRLVPKELSTGKIGFDLVTRTGQWGVDRTGTAQVIFGPAWGNLEQPHLTLSHRDEVTVVYGGGQGEGSDRYVTEQESTARSGASPWNRIEAFVDARDCTTATAVIDRAQEYLEAHRPRLRFTGNLKDTPQSRFQVDWDFGDAVVLQYRKWQGTGRVSSFTWEVSEDEQESLSAGVEVDE